MLMELMLRVNMRTGVYKTAVVVSLPRPTIIQSVPSLS